MHLYVGPDTWQVCRGVIPTKARVRVSTFQSEHAPLVRCQVDAAAQVGRQLGKLLIFQGTGRHNLHSAVCWVLVALLLVALLQEILSCATLHASMFFLVAIQRTYNSRVTDAPSWTDRTLTIDIVRTRAAIPLHCISAERRWLRL